MRRLLLVGLVACGTAPASAPPAPVPPPAAEAIAPPPPRPLPFALPEGASTLSTSSLDGARSIALELPGDEAAGEAWARRTLAGLGCRDVAPERPYEELELRCRDRAGTSAVVARVGERTTIVVTWTEAPTEVDVAE